MSSPQPIWNWTFKGYVDSRSEWIQAWYENETAVVQAEFDWLLKRLRDRSNTDWSNLGGCKSIRGGQNQGLFELRFEAERVPYRPIGIFGVGRQTFTILTIAKKKDFKAECGTAQTRKSLVEDNPEGYSRESRCLSDFIGKAKKG